MKWVREVSKILFTPGPTNIPEPIREVLGQDLIHHRIFHILYEIYK